MPGANRNEILGCCCSQEAVPGATPVTDSLGTSELQVEILTRPGNTAVTQTSLCSFLHALPHTITKMHHIAGPEGARILICCAATVTQITAAPESNVPVSMCL